MKTFPQSTLGKLSVGLAVAMPILFVIGGSLASSLYINVAAGNSITEDMAQRPLLAWTMLIAMSFGILALVTGALAIKLKKDQTTLVWIATGLGAFLLVFLLGELVFPH